MAISCRILMFWPERAPQAPPSLGRGRGRNKKVNTLPGSLACTDKRLHILNRDGGLLLPVPLVERKELLSIIPDEDNNRGHVVD